MIDYTYLGDRLSNRRGHRCTAIRNADGKCIRGRNGNMLVQFENGDRVVVVARLLRKVKPT